MELFVLNPSDRTAQLVGNSLIGEAQKATPVGQEVNGKTHTASVQADEVVELPDYLQDIYFILLLTIYICSLELVKS